MRTHISPRPIFCHGTHTHTHTHLTTTRFAPIHSFVGTVYSRGMSCTRFYYMLWYEKFKRAMGGRSGFVAPYWDGPEVPVWNKTHDQQVEVWREERKRRESVL